MVEIRNVPPGRAGRLWLNSRLRAARLAAELLQRKLVLLSIEQRRLEQAVTASASRWRSADLAADQRLARASFLATPFDANLSTPTDPAVVTVEWSNLMGARYPTRARVRAPAIAAGQRSPGSPALLAASAAVTEAVRVAAEHAVDVAALRAVTTESAVTRRRLRAITRRWIPRLEDASTELARRLDEGEREESFRLHLIAGTS
jgi:V/A-type H+/Na+-transporting ATPase subunit D